LFEKGIQMTIFYTKRPGSGATLEPGENLLIWFGNSSIDDCNNALLLAGGDLLLLKTAKRISRNELEELSADYSRWVEVFGTGRASDELQAGMQEFNKVNPSY
jgi:hypothetical protein